jgi:hypothetical protein
MYTEDANNIREKSIRNLSTEEQRQIRSHPNFVMAPPRLPPNPTFEDVNFMYYDGYGLDAKLKSGIAPITRKDYGAT